MNRGNPVIFGAAVREQILSGEDHIGCRQWRADNSHAVHHFDTDSQRFIIDLDTPEDVERFERNTGHALRWPAGSAVGSTTWSPAPAPEAVPCAKPATTVNMLCCDS